MRVQSYRDLEVWQRAMDLVTSVYEVTEQFPKEEVYGLTSQMRRAAISIPSNIAEGKYRTTTQDYIRFLNMAYSSGAELETQVEIAKRLSKTELVNYQEVDALLNEVMRMLNAMLRKLRTLT